MAKEKKGKTEEKVRVKLRAYDQRMLDQSAKQIVNIVKYTGAKVFGPIPLPTERKFFTVLRSPHVNKKSREQFQMETHKRILDVVNPTSKTIDALMKLNLPAGVDVEVKL